MESAPVKINRSDIEFAGVAQKRAALINKKHHQKQAEQLALAKRALLESMENKYGGNFKELATSNMSEMWRLFVRDKYDAEAFMELMYPQFPKQVQLAYIHMFERAINGEIQLDKKYIRDNNETSSSALYWNPLEDIERERQIGVENRARKMMEELLKDD